MRGGYGYVIGEKIKMKIAGFFPQLFDAFPTVRRDAEPQHVPTTRQTGERRRRIIDVDIVASLNRVMDLRITPVIIVLGPLSSVASHGERTCRKPFRKFWPNQRRWGPAQR